MSLCCLKIVETLLYKNIDDNEFKHLLKKVIKIEFLNN